MKISLFYRIASALLILFAVGHTLGFRRVDPHWGIDSIITTLRSTHFNVQGLNRTYWDFYSRIPESLAYVTRRQGQWERSESYFNEAERLDPRNGIYSPSTRFPISTFVVSPKRCESLIRFLISHRTTWILLR